MATGNTRTVETGWSSARPVPAWAAAWGLAWRCAVVALVPIAVWAWDRLLYDYTPDRAAWIEYEVRINRLTGSACLKFKGEIPEGLKHLAC